MAVKMVTDTTSYIPREMQESLGISVLPLWVHFPDEVFKENEVDYTYFYSKIAKTGIIPTSSQPSLADVQQLFRTLIESGNDVVAVFISAKFSGTYDTALSAKERLLEEYPAARIEIIDSEENCMALGFPVVEGAKAALEGKNVDEVAAQVNDCLSKTRFIFAPANLDYLKKGGRIGKAAGLLGSMLRITPILTVEEGTVAVMKKVRGFSTAIQSMLDEAAHVIRETGVRNIVVHHIESPIKARQMAASLEHMLGFLPDIMSIGPVIGLHVGPGAVGIVYTSK